MNLVISILTICLVVIKVETQCMLEREICSCEPSSVSCTQESNYLASFLPSLQAFFDIQTSYISILIINKNYEAINERSFANFTIAELFLNNNRFKSVSDKAFEGLKGLETLRLENNRLQFIYFNSSLPDLTTLYLNNNELEEIQPDAFDKLTKLEKLDLSQNYIRQFDSNLATLKEIDLSSNLLSVMIPGKRMQHLSILIIKTNYLTKLDRALFANFSSLSRLDISSNLISKIEQDSFEDIKNTLTKLALEDNILDSSCLKPINQLTSLKSLVLAQNRISTLYKSDLDNLKSLSRFDISGNGLSFIESQSFSSFQQLIDIDLSNNLISEYNFNFGASLQVLNLGANPIQTNLSFYHFAGLTDLTKLRIYSTSVPYVNDFAFADLVQLESLYMNSMKLVDINRNTFKGLVSLKLLYLYKNRITKLTNRTFNELISLVELDLSFNRISYIDSGAFDGLSSLIRLRLDGNKFKLFSSAFYSLNTIKSLKNLFIQFNQISQFEEITFKGFESYVTRLRLDNNKINYIKKSHFSSLSKLIYLNLSFNQISSIEKSSFDNLTRLVYLNLEGNNVFKVVNLVTKSMALLYLDHNLISSITPNSFEYAKYSLVAISVRGNCLTSLTSRLFAGFENLYVLSFSSNLIEVVYHDAFDDIPNLNDLDLSYNNIKQVTFEPYSQYLLLPDSLRCLYLDSAGPVILDAINFTSLSTLYQLSIVNIQQPNAQLVNSILASPKITYLDFADNGLSLDSITTSFPITLSKIDLNSIRGFSWSKFLSLSLNALDVTSISLAKIDLNEMDSQLSLFQKLQQVDLSQNKLKMIQKSNFKYNIHLKSVNLSFNNIKNIENLSFEVNSYLACLDLSYNQLETFNQSALFGKNGLSHLTRLVVNNNRIKIFFLYVGNVDLYVELNNEEIKVDSIEFRLDSNRLGDLPDLQGAVLSQINNLDLSRNEISVIPDDYFLNMAELGYLNLGQNLIKHIEAFSFRMISSLKELDLGHNNLSCLHPMTFDGLARLQKLNISHNYLKLISSDLFVNLNELSVLDLSYNLILQIQDYSFSSLTSLSLLYLNSNPVKNLYKTEILQGLENIKFFYLPSSLVVDQQSEQVILKMNLSRVLTPARYMSDIYLVFYESVGLINQYESSYYAYELSDCLTIINLVKHNIQLNLNDDKNVNKFLNECSEKVTRLSSDSN